MTVLTRGHTLGLLMKSQSTSGMGKNREGRAGWQRWAFNSKLTPINTPRRYREVEINLLWRLVIIIIHRGLEHDGARICGQAWGREGGTVVGVKRKEAKSDCGQNKESINHFWNLIYPAENSTRQVGTHDIKDNIIGHSLNTIYASEAPATRHIERGTPRASTPLAL